MSFLLDRKFPVVCRIRRKYTSARSLKLWPSQYINKDKAETPQRLSDLLACSIPPLDDRSSSRSPHSSSASTLQASKYDIKTDVEYQLYIIQYWEKLNSLAGYSRKVLDFVTDHHPPSQPITNYLDLKDVWTPIMSVTGAQYFIEPEFAVSGGACDRLISARVSEPGLSSTPELVSEPTSHNVHSLEIKRYPVIDESQRQYAIYKQSEGVDTSTLPNGDSVVSIPFKYPIYAVGESFKRAGAPPSKLALWENVYLQAWKCLVQASPWGSLASDRHFIPIIRVGPSTMAVGNRVLSDNWSLAYVGQHMLRIAVERHGPSKEEFSNIDSEVQACLLETFHPLITMFGNPVPPHAQFYTERGTGTSNRGSRIKTTKTKKGNKVSKPVKASEQAKTLKESNVPERSESLQKPTGNHPTKSKRVPPASSTKQQNTTPLPDRDEMTAVERDSGSEDIVPQHREEPLTMPIVIRNRTEEFRLIVPPPNHPEVGDVIKLTNRIGSGVLGTVYRGRWNDVDVIGKVVAIGDEEDATSLEKEAEVYLALQEQWGRAVPSFYGLFKSRHRLLLLLSYEGQPVSKHDLQK
ncbi:hypothetical protein DACRYDRAFT_109191 [Dacryopinax primogenitus]|uniref:Protein kinase domain-containing protein n=1 Tax=Dacryopinax primogenitus (strain DJM 731) TaxID=1858805 RepID=M5G3N9_DACPD|nr:uncharacterized protein DACRYDRAFT_109191 [Dacryopinax primogenitus]EJU00472.1 hypothetical protein DACRYDRAFT_109191 [Dacryopinax primogenitus]